jgi:hypothetical protein
MGKTITVTKTPRRNTYNVGMLKLEQGKGCHALGRYRSRQFVGQSLQVLFQPVVSSSVSAVVVSPVGARASRTEPQGLL